MMDYQTRKSPTRQRTQHYLSTTRHLSSVMGLSTCSVTTKGEIVDVPSPAVCGLTMALSLGPFTLHCSVDIPTVMQQRRERDTLPAKIRNSDRQQEDIWQELTNKQLEQKDYHNRSVRELPWSESSVPGSTVRPLGGSDCCDASS